MDKQTLAAMRRIVIHMAIGESQHFDESGKPRNHIYRDVLKLAKFIDRNSTSKRKLLNY